MMDFLPVYTIGHSTRPLDEFVELLRLGSVRQLVDVRSIPRSRTNPQYNLATLPAALADRQIGHTLIRELGGRRPAAQGVASAINAFWRNRSFHNYADHALSADFRAGMDRLLSMSEEAVCAVMCAEAVWWRCHRRIIADYLLLAGRKVVHLMGTDRMEPASMTPVAVRAGNVLHYPAAAPVSAL